MGLECGSFDTGEVDNHPSSSNHVVDRNTSSENEKVPGDLETAPAQENYPNHNDTPMSLRAVTPVDVRIRNLNVAIDVSPSPIESLLKSVSWKGPKADEATTKTILHDVLTDMPSSTLTAIVGGSGSGKVSIPFCLVLLHDGSRCLARSSTSDVLLFAQR